MSGLEEFAPAKINLHLHVVGRREDGYHLLDSLVTFADVGDRLSVSPADTLSLSVTGPFAAGLETEADNLVLRAARALLAQAGGQRGGRLVLEKNLPVASGIGGGSADAAAALRLLRRFWDIEISGPNLGILARRLGADVPVCLAGCSAMMSGTGEGLASAPPLPEVGLLLVNPGVAVATPLVFLARTGGFSEPARFPGQGWRDAGTLVADLCRTRNDLEAPARSLAPEIGDALAVISALPGCRLARMSGSGATCFGIFDTPGAARRASGTIRRAGWWVWGGGLHTP